VGTAPGCGAGRIADFFYIDLSLLTNTAIPGGLRPATAKDQRTSTFPYVVPA
jgi:hypothetical protein